MKNLFTFFSLFFSLFSLASSYSNFPMGSNGSDSSLQTRQINVILRSGVVFSTRNAANRLNTQTKICTLGFAVKRVKRLGTGGSSGTFNQGYLGAGSCSPSRGGSGGGNSIITCYRY